MVTIVASVIDDMRVCYLGQQDDNITSKRHQSSNQSFCFAQRIHNTVMYRVMPNIKSEMHLNQSINDIYIYIFYLSVGIKVIQSKITGVILKVEFQLSIFVSSYHHLIIE